MNTTEELKKNFILEEEPAPTKRQLQKEQDIKELVDKFQPKVVKSRGKPFMLVESHEVTPLLSVNIH